MKRIKHRDLTHYFLEDHRRLPRAYVASCERFFKSFKLQTASSFRMVLTNKRKYMRKAPSYKRQASSCKRHETATIK